MANSAASDPGVPVESMQSVHTMAKVVKKGGTNRSTGYRVAVAYHASTLPVADGRSCEIGLLPALQLAFLPAVVSRTRGYSSSGIPSGPLLKESLEGRGVK